MRTGDGRGAGGWRGWLARVWGLWRGGEKRGPESARQGRWGEERAADFLKRKGWRIAERNVKYGNRLELDLVGVDGDTLVFVEVKTRSSEAFGRPLDAVDAGKRRRTAQAAVRYLRRLRGEIPPKVRFDVVEVVGRAGEGEARVRHIENAFVCPDGIRLPERRRERRTGR